MEDVEGVTARRNLGDMAFEKGAFNTAIKYYTRAIARHPRGAWALWRIANAKFENGQFNESVKFCTLASDVVPQVSSVTLFSSSDLTHADVAKYRYFNPHFNSFLAIRPCLNVDALISNSEN